VPIAFRSADDASGLNPIEGMSVRHASDAAFMAELQRRSVDEIQARCERGHRAYVAWIDGAPAAWGWVATRSAEIGELKSSFDIPDGARYLWNFVTLSTYRGRGIYPRLVDEIVRQESAEAREFWIAYAPENHASGSGIAKAGFLDVAELSFDAAGRPAVQGLLHGAGPIVSALLGIPEADKVSRCWKCVRAGRGDMSCAEGECRCDYQKPEIHCAA